MYGQAAMIALACPYQFCVTVRTPLVGKKANQVRHLERSPAEIPLGYASCFWGKPQKFDKLRMTPIGVRRGAVETRRATGTK